VTEGTQEPALIAEAPPAAVSRAAAETRPGVVRRTFDWFWRGRQLKELRESGSVESPHVGKLTLRSRLMFELGERALRPAEPLPYPGDAAASELYRQAAYWAVRAIAEAIDPSPERASDPWSVLGEPLRQSLAGSSERLSELKELIENGSFSQAWELSEEQRASRATELAGVAKILLAELAWRARARDALWIQRILRLCLLLVMVVGLIGGVRWVMSRSEQARDLAVGKPWRASSTMGGFGCTSPLQECGEKTDFFFHTTDEKSPWLEIDLGTPSNFSAVRVENRRDCCFDRAVPLIVEVSNDQKNFREVARQTTSASSWLARFAPTNARYVRLRVARQSMLHLARVRVLR
jgi:hypothetical protein